MAAKNLFSLDLAANTDAASGAVPANKAWSFGVNFCNRNETPVTVRLAICATTTPGATEYFIYETVIDGYGALERTGLIAQDGKYVVVRASAANVSVNGYGFE